MPVSLPSRYPVELPPRHPALRNLTRIKLPERHPLLPPLYKFDPSKFHQLCPEVTGSIYVYLFDPSPEGKEVFCAIEEFLPVPAGPVEGEGNDGVYCLT